MHTIYRHLEYLLGRTKSNDSKSGREELNEYDPDSGSMKPKYTFNDTASVRPEIR